MYDINEYNNNYIMNDIYNQVVMYTTNCVYGICKYIVSVYKGILKCPTCSY